MKKYRDFLLVAALFAIVYLGALTASGRVDDTLGSLSNVLAWLTG